MIRSSLLALVLAVGGAHTGTSQNPGAQNPGALEGDAKNGKALFKAYTCYGCHGYTGETGFASPPPALAATRLNPPRMPQARFIAYLRNPTRPRRMPPYQQSEVSDQKLADIYAFLQSLPSGSPEVESIPLLQAILEESRK